MIQRVVDLALREKALVLFIGFILLLGGGFAFHNLPIEAYPDVANNWVQIITQWPGRAAEEVEQQVACYHRDPGRRRTPPNQLKVNFNLRSVRRHPDFRRRIG